MGFWKRLTRSLFGSFLSPKKKRRKNRKRIKKSKGIKQKKAARSNKRGRSLPRYRPLRSRKVQAGQASTSLAHKPLKGKSQKQPPKISSMKQEGILVGRVTHYFPKIEVAVLTITQGVLHPLDPIRIKGDHTDFKQSVASMQMNHEPIEKAVRGNDIGLKVKEPVREGDLVYRLNEP